MSVSVYLPPLRFLYTFIVLSVDEKKIRNRELADLERSSYGADTCHQAPCSHPNASILVLPVEVGDELVQQKTPPRCCSMLLCGCRLYL